MHRLFFALCLCLVLSSFLFSVHLFAAAGDLDTTFSQDGRVVTSFGSTWSGGVYDVAIQPDTKIVAVGLVSHNTSHGIGLARYNSDGTLDTTFGNSGRKVTMFQGKDSARDCGCLAGHKYPDWRLSWH